MQRKLGILLSKLFQYLLCQESRACIKQLSLTPGHCICHFLDLESQKHSHGLIHLFIHASVQMASHQRSQSSSSHTRLHLHLSPVPFTCLISPQHLPSGTLYIYVFTVCLPPLEQSSGKQDLCYSPIVSQHPKQWLAQVGIRCSLNIYDENKQIDI